MMYIIGTGPRAVGMGVGAVTDACIRPYSRARAVPCALVPIGRGEGGMTSDVCVLVQKLASADHLNAMINQVGSWGHQKKPHCKFNRTLCDTANILSITFL